MNYLELGRLAVPEALLVVTALVALGVDLAGRPGGEGPGDEGAWERRAGRVLGIGVAGCVLTLGWLVAMRPEGALPGGMFVSDAVTRWVRAALVSLTAGTLLLSWRMRFTPHVGEYVTVVLLGTVGMMWVAAAENVLMLFLGLELASLSLYILTAFDKRDPASTEAGLKYFLFGGMAGAFLLLGLSFLYGATGAIEFRAMAAGLAGAGDSPLALAGLALVLVGLGFKVAAAPFHFWAPDAYQGAPTPAAGLMAAGAKVAALFILAKFAVVGLGTLAGDGSWAGLRAGWAPLLGLVAAVSMVWGNLAALAQRNVKRLLAYSAVAHAGYALVGVMGGGAEAVAAVTFHAVTYALTTLGAFGVVGLVEKAAGGSEFGHFAGLARRAPGLALCLAVFVLSLAGIPPLVGFFGKFYLFATALGGGDGGMGLLWLVALGAATTCVSFYYYLRLLKEVFVSEPGTAGWEGMAGGGVERWTVGAAATGVVAAGCLPAVLLEPLRVGLVALGL
ncbi:MAG: NADH-quinone oxidoreductase subunit N [Verrucomicrobiae bacterium]|nr:NADH-quinone oxidoreductase subunit N [Verrucomicrobiae bacterium]